MWAHCSLKDWLDVAGRPHPPDCHPAGRDDNRPPSKWDFGAPAIVWLCAYLNV
jgi:hypothetical protein